jgi:hypothetical protein
LKSVAAHYQIIQGGQIFYSFHQVAAGSSTVATLAGQLLPQQGGATYCGVPPTVPRDKLSDLLCPFSGRLASFSVPSLSI